ncbi:homogentisate 1,2-dioxygenase [Legionella sp. km772]|uniref:homogentisate 1,2-dioxygenase n=1 Tax=Legionella sp. km772 TaxID=2498111 RepID=UPI000F8C3459|nr:homogentisate 1,2-dioxygenase [Legionella sp. km772]RUR12384.1 homogentisate 1,2-dioxygenase [Legionella sp. km772]
MYLQGFGNYHHTEAVPGAMPVNQNSPQQCKFGLYAEQLSGTAFTRPRSNNLRSWLYRILPSVAQGSYEPYQHVLNDSFYKPHSPNALRWSPVNKRQDQADFIHSLFHLAGTALNNAYLYHCNQSMTDTYFVNNDGDFLFVPYEGELNLHTECGLLALPVGTIAVIPRGIKFKVELVSQEAKGYLGENGGNPFVLPSLGAIGANGLANPRHFEYPCAAYEKELRNSRIICKNHHQLWIAHCDHSPLNVVAWHGNYAPYRYDLSLFNTINTVSFDHPDPSIFTVLTSESDTPGVANLDFVIFPPRWMVAEHTFRPPYFHRNYMNELMGLIRGVYDAKKEGFTPGGVSIHNCMTPHGPDYDSYKKAASQELKPQFNDSLAFMFETKDPWLATQAAMGHLSFQTNYIKCWGGFKAYFLETKTNN